MERSPTLLLLVGAPGAAAVTGFEPVVLTRQVDVHPAVHVQVRVAVRTGHTHEHTYTYIKECYQLLRDQKCA